MIKMPFAGGMGFKPKCLQSDYCALNTRVDFFPQLISKTFDFQDNCVPALLLRKIYVFR